MNDRKVCPFRVNGRVLTDVRCTGSSCAWWCGFAQECAVPLLAGTFSDSKEAPEPSRAAESPTGPPRKRPTNGAPAQTQRSGLRGERSRSEVSETCRLRRGERYAACGDEAV